VAHVGGPIILGTPTVLIGNLPASRAGDLALCTGSVDAIQTGSATVLIANMPAARMGDTSFHGGVIAGGLPTVLIGGAAAAVKKPEGLPRPDKRYRIRIVKGESNSLSGPTPVPGVDAEFRKGKITFEILDTEANFSAKFIFDWKAFGLSPRLPNFDRPGNPDPGPGPWKDFSGPDMPLEQFAGDVFVRPETFGPDMDLYFLDDDSQAVGDSGKIEDLGPGSDFDPDARPVLFNAFGELEQEKDSTKPYMGD
jgi:uncharacterized Zn-binding protein involved in type VI secretion